MSIREEIQVKLGDWLYANAKYDAPYGVCPGMETLANSGKVRTITFGMARSLDATVFIWSPKKFTFRAQGPASRDLNGVEVHSYEEVIALLTKL